MRFLLKTIVATYVLKKLATAYMHKRARTVA